MGTLIRHARLPGRPALPVLALAVAMIEPAFGAALVALVGGPMLAPARIAAANRAAIALAAITVRADEEQGRASTAHTQPCAENCFAMNRHAVRLAGFDNDDRSWEVRG